MLRVTAIVYGKANIFLHLAPFVQLWPVIDPFRCDTPKTRLQGTAALAQARRWPGSLLDRSLSRSPNVSEPLIQLMGGLRMYSV